MEFFQVSTYFSLSLKKAKTLGNPPKNLYVSISDV